jgi:hypothetical protein
MSRKIAPLHVWDVGSIETTYACGAEPEQPAICAVISSRHLPSMLRLDRSPARICPQCRSVIAERSPSPAKPRRSVGGTP